jgi:methyltransferase (TIGR00027 family)
MQHVQCDSMTDSQISHVSDTARWVAMYRVMESERPDALFRDPYACRLAGERGAAILGAVPKGREWAWPMIVRTAVFDELIRETVGRGADTVLNLAAGLDARPYRMALPSGLRWIEVDFPDVLEYKRNELAGERPVCRIEREPADLTDAEQRRAVLAKVARGARRVLVVCEGLLIYLRPEQVAALAADLRAQRAFRWWLIDLASPRLLQWMDRGWGPAVRGGSAAFHFAPADGTAFFAPHGWREAEFRSTMVDARRLKRAPRIARLWRLLGLLQSRKRRQEMARFSGSVLLERA